MKLIDKRNAAIMTMAIFLLGTVAVPAAAGESNDIGPSDPRDPVEEIIQCVEKITTPSGGGQDPPEQGPAGARFVADVDQEAYRPQRPPEGGIYEAYRGYGPYLEDFVLKIVPGTWYVWLDPNIDQICPSE